METIHVNFDELTEMASEQNSLGPTTNRLNFPDQSAESLSLNRKELETLFAPLFDDSFACRAPNVSNVSAAPPDDIPIPDTPAPTTTIVAIDAPPIESPTTVEQTASNTETAAEDQPEFEVPTPADYDVNAFFNPFAPIPTILNIAESSTRTLDPSIMHNIYQHHPSTHQWTKDHPLVNIIGNPEAPVMTRQRLHSDG